MREPIPAPSFYRKQWKYKQGDTPEVLQRRVMEQAEWKILARAMDLIANDEVAVRRKSMDLIGKHDMEKHGL